MEPPLSQPRTAPEAAPASPGSLGFLVGALLAAHGSATMAFLGLPVIAPQVAQAYGFPVYMIGYQASLTSLGLLVSILFCSNFPSAIGGARTIQLGLALLILGTLLASTGNVPLLVIGSLSLGCGYGMLTPAGSEMLYRFTPAHRRNVVFSLKQCGVPLGAVLAATLGPAAAVTAGWRAALWVYIALLAATLLLFHAGRRRWGETLRRPAALFSEPLRALAMTWERPAIRFFALGCSFLNAAQSVLLAYTVTLFHEEFGVALIRAGLFLTVAQAGGVCGRLAWGWLADRSRDCAATLMVVAGVITLCALAIGTLSLGWPRPLIFILFFIFGMTASGWNGVFLAEVARMAPPGRVALATGGGLFVLNVGYLLAPVVFAAVYGVVPSYTFCFALLAFAGASAMTLLYFARSEARRAPL